MRLLALFIGLALLFLIPFFVWGEALEARFTTAGAVDWLRAQGVWAWALGVALLVGDLFLPLPSTAVMSALGAVYGTWLGGTIAAGGSMLAGLVGYGLCRALGRGAAEKIAGAEDLARAEAWFQSRGGWAVAFSRWLPLLAEVVACMAGLTRMPLRTFTVALACGSIPVSLVFAAVGASGAEHPALALALSAGLPLLLWPVAQWFVRRR